MGQHRSEGERRREVARWRASGVSAWRYARTHGMSETSLKRWAAVDEGEAMSQAAAFVRLQVAGRAVGTGLVVEVGRARVRVEPGFDGQLLRAVVAALATEATP